MRIQTTVAGLIVSSLLWNSAAMAQERHVVPQAEMREAIAVQSAADQQNRDTLLGAMAREDVRALANQLGLSLTRAEGAVATLDSAELASLAGPIQASDPDLAGGANVVVISTTTLLLVLIIIILILK